jgi:hypothetical protein
VILKNNFLQGNYEQKNKPALTNWGKNILPSIWWENKCCKTAWCRDRFDQSGKISWFDFQGLV